MSKIKRSDPTYSDLLENATRIVTSFGYGEGNERVKVLYDAAIKFLIAAFKGKHEE